MKKLVIILHLLLFTNLSGYAQSGLEEKVNPIRNWYKEVEGNLSKYLKVEYKDIDVCKDTNKENYSLEGSKIYRLAKVDMAKYFSDNLVVKILVIMKGDREGLRSEYYYKNGDLVFFKTVKTIYQKPKWHENHDKTKFSTLKNHFYFKDNELIKWVDHKVNTVSKNNPNYADKGSQILHDSKLYRHFQVSN